MEDSPLNLAHREDRRAQNHLRAGRFDEAVKCHQLAAKYFEDAMNTTSTSRALESLQLQREYHLRQLQIVELKKTQLFIFKKALENKRKIMAHMKEKILVCDQKGQEPKTLQTAIYRTMQEADSLFELLVHRGGVGNDEQMSHDKDSEDIAPTPQLVGSKHPKEDRVVIEELHTLNHQLRSLVNALMIQLDESERENKALRLRISELENKLIRSEESNTLNGGPIGLQVITDSTGDNFSPFVLSPISQLSPDAADTRELPALAPLEMPKFDFNM